MANFPSLDYSTDYSYSFSPDVIRTEYASANTRQRSLFGGSSYVFSVGHRLSNSELDTFETFVLETLNNGADEYTAPFYASDYLKTGTAQIIGGKYDTSYLTSDYWSVSYRFELKNRDFTDEANLYESVNALGGFESSYGILDALENMINNNNL